MSKIEKILHGQSGQSVKIKPDWTVINDGISHEAIDVINNIDHVFNNKKTIIVIDHDVPAGNSDSSIIFQKLVAFSKKHDVEFIQAKGITYVVMLESYVEKNNIIVSCGNHNSIYGSSGALGLKVNSETLVKILETGEYELKIPETVLVKFQGELPVGISAIDVFINLLGTIDSKLVDGKSLEFTGESFLKLTQHDKKVLFSMATRTGALTSLENEIPEGKYYNEIIFDLNKVEPVVALPVEDQKVATFKYEKITALNSLEFDVGFIGGYTGGYIEDLRLAAELMKNKKIALGFRLNICPASSQIYLQAMDEGLLDIFINFGAQILAPSDRNITLYGAGVVGPKEKVITTGSYNFSGCLGSDDASVYIASVRSVVNAALTKHI
ncbi:aconitase family protein [Pectobacterium cacticida]|uniref:aconitase family protein n=1 Tax=Pectobacterium cacticida TaxID=69221 RepID=UPI002FF3BDCB